MLEDETVIVGSDCTESLRLVSMSVRSPFCCVYFPSSPPAGCLFVSGGNAVLEDAEGMALVGYGVVDMLEGLFAAIGVWRMDITKPPATEVGFDVGFFVGVGSGVGRLVGSLVGGLVSGLVAMAGAGFCIDSGFGLVAMILLALVG